MERETPVAGRPRDAHGRTGHAEAGHRWWQVVCLTGVNYFSTIVYRPAIAFVAVGSATRRASWTRDMALLLVGTSTGSAG